MKIAIGLPAALRRAGWLADADLSVPADADVIRSCTIPVRSRLWRR